MSCYAMLCYVMYVMLCYVMLCYVKLCYVMIWYVMYVMLCYVMLCLLCCVMLCYAMSCYFMLCYVMYVMLCYDMIYYDMLFQCYLSIGNIASANLSHIGVSILETQHMQILAVLVFYVTHHSTPRAICAEEDAHLLVLGEVL